MSRERTTETVIVGGGQAGLSLSRALTIAGRPHVVLERGRVGERWRSARWESLTLLTPAWASTLDGQRHTDDPDRFLTRAEFVDGLDAYASSFAAPVREGVRVRDVRLRRDGFRVETDRSVLAARNVVVATGDCDVPRLPAAASAVPRDVLSLTSNRYVAPEALPPGGVLVVGAGPTGQQLALELARAGRDVTIAVGRHARMPRRYRGSDLWRWLEGLGDLDVAIDDVRDPRGARRSPSLPVTGANGGEDLDLGVLGRAGVAVCGRLIGFDSDVAQFGAGLAADLADADERMRRLLGRIDVLADRIGAPDAEPIPGVELPAGCRRLDLRARRFGTVLWATGYRRSYPWLRIPVVDSDGDVIQRHGVTPVEGLYTLGMKFQRRRRSHFIDGVGADAAFLVERIEARAAARR